MVVESVIAVLTMETALAALISLLGSAGIFACFEYVGFFQRLCLPAKDERKIAEAHLTETPYSKWTAKDTEAFKSLNHIDCARLIFMGILFYAIFSATAPLM